MVGEQFLQVCFITHDSDIHPWVGSKIIDEGDVRNLSLMCDSIHHGGLAGVELTHATSFGFNAETREPTRSLANTT